MLSAVASIYCFLGNILCALFQKTLTILETASLNDDTILEAQDARELTDPASEAVAGGASSICFLVRTWDQSSVRASGEMEVTSQISRLGNDDHLSGMCISIAATASVAAPASRPALRRAVKSI